MIRVAYGFGFLKNSAANNKLNYFQIYHIESGCLKIELEIATFTRIFHSLDSNIYIYIPSLSIHVNIKFILAMLTWSYLSFLHCLKRIAVFIRLTCANS